jgi:glycine dehydrogenase subunit 1
MPYVPHTEADKQAMLDVIGVSSIEELFDAVPAQLIQKDYFDLPSGLSELETNKKISNIARRNKNAEVSFLGGGFYHHYIPSHVTNVGSRSEFFTAYTPYQPEMSQGILQAIFEYQTMITRLTGMDSTNASMYDGSSATAEVCFMASAITRRKKILVAKTVHPQYREVMLTYCEAKGLEYEEVNYLQEAGTVDMDHLKSLLSDEVAGVFVQSPNFFGVVEDMKVVSDSSHEQKSLAIQVVTEALSLGALATPGSQGVDIVVGEGQSFGLPVSGGGPSFGFLATTKKYMRKLPGRIAGETEDSDGNKAYVLTLQAREQHIRREKASSNICTNQTLCAVRGLIYLSSLGKKLGDLAMLNHKNSLHFQKQLAGKGLSRKFSSPFFNEFVVEVSDVEATLKKLKAEGIFGGLDLGKVYPELKNHLLVCVTEMIGEEEMQRYLAAL